MPKTISIIAPFLNEESVIQVFYVAIEKIMDNNSYEFELLLVDDGSNDKSLKIAHEIAKLDSRVKILSLSRNFGQIAAFSCGLKYANGDAAILMDIDLQDPPEIIDSFLLEWEKGAKIVNAKRISRAGESNFKILSSKIFFRILRKLSSVNIPLDTGYFSLLDREIIDLYNSLGEKNKFPRGLIPWFGFTQKEIAFSRQQRLQGETKYKLTKLISLAIDGLTSFSTKPLRFASVFGVIISFFSALFAFFTVFSKVLDLGFSVPGYTTLVALLGFLSGIQLVTLGIVGEYLGKVYEEVKNRPEFIVNFEKSTISERKE